MRLGSYEAGKLEGYEAGKLGGREAGDGENECCAKGDIQWI